MATIEVPDNGELLQSVLEDGSWEMLWSLELVHMVLLYKNHS